MLIVMEPNAQNAGGSKLPRNPLKGLSKTAKLVLGGAGVVIFLLITLVIYSSFIRKPDNSIQLAAVGRQQANLIQAAKIGVKDARSQEARNLAITTQLSLVGDQKPLLKALKSQNVSVSTKDDPKITQKFTLAQQSNNLDTELVDYLHTELSSYAKNIKTAYNTTKDQALRKVLADQYKNAQFLAGEHTQQ